MNVLAHHMVYIAERLAFAGDDTAKAALVRRAHSQWDHQPQYQWVERDEVITTRETISVSRLQQETFLHIADEAVESRCTSCGVRLSVEVLSSHDGCCEACSVSYDQGLHWLAMDNVVSAGNMFHQTDSQTSGPWVPQGFAVDQIDKSIHDMLNMHENPADSRDNAIVPGVWNHRSNRKEMTWNTPEAWRPSGFMQIRSGAPGVGNLMTRESIYEHIPDKLDIYPSTRLNMSSTPPPRTDNMLAALKHFRSCEAGTTARSPHTLRSSDVYIKKKAREKRKYSIAKYTREIPVSNESNFDNDYTKPADPPFGSHSMVRSKSPPIHSNCHKLLV